jgi:hypothetical protein
VFNLSIKDVAMHKLLTENPGQKMLLLGNEAIARGAIEAGMKPLPEVQSKRVLRLPLPIRAHRLLKFR